jgi:hypothetical protein
MAYYYRQVGNVAEAERYYSIYASISSYSEAPEPANTVTETPRDNRMPDVPPRN